MVRTASAIHVVQSSADHTVYGIEDVRHVRGDIFIIAKEDGAYPRNYLFHASLGDASYLGDGRIQVVDATDLVFRVEQAESSWKPFDFQYDAIIDGEGHILDIVTPRESYRVVVCMGLEVLASRSVLDVSRVSDRDGVCVQQ